MDTYGFERGVDSLTYPSFLAVLAGQWPMIRERSGRVLGLGGGTSHRDGIKEMEEKGETAKCLPLIQSTCL